MDKSKFSINEREGKYEVVLIATCEISETIQAGSLAEAEKEAEEMSREEGLENRIYQVEECTVDRVYKCRPMYRVWDGGQKFQVTNLQDHHTPRDPDENGF